MDKTTKRRRNLPSYITGTANISNPESDADDPDEHSQENVQHSDSTKYVRLDDYWSQIF